MDESSQWRRRKDGFTARTKQRNRALDVIFEADERDLLGMGDLLVLLEQRKLVSTAQTPIGDFGSQIVRAYAENSDDVDTLVEAASEDWAMRRMNAVDRSILRAAAAELVYVGTERAHVIPEWAGLAREYSTERSVGFVMGILNKVADIRERELAGASFEGSPSPGSEDADDNATAGDSRAELEGASAGGETERAEESESAQ